MVEIRACIVLLRLISFPGFGCHHVTNSQCPWNQSLLFLVYNNIHSKESCGEESRGETQKTTFF